MAAKAEQAANAGACGGGRHARVAQSPFPTTGQAGIRGRTALAEVIGSNILERGASRARIAQILALLKRLGSRWGHEVVLARARPILVPHVRWHAAVCKRQELGGEIGALQAEALRHVQDASRRVELQVQRRLDPGGAGGAVRHLERRREGRLHGGAVLER